MAKKKGTRLRTLTTLEEKMRRFDYINGKFMLKYLDLVWLARSDPDKLIEEEKYEIVQQVMNSIKKIAEKYPKDSNELIEDDTNWQHGFNSGVLAYARFLSTYLEDILWEVGEINKDMVPYEKVVNINGIDYIQYNGRRDAVRDFPELYT